MSAFIATGGGVNKPLKLVEISLRTEDFPAKGLPETIWDLFIILTLIVHNQRHGGLQGVQKTTTRNVNMIDALAFVVGIIVLIFIIRKVSTRDVTAPAEERVSEALGGWALSNQGMQYAAAGQFAAAERMLLRAIEVTERDDGPTHKNLAICYNNFAGYYDMQRRFDDAKAQYLRAMEIWNLSGQQGCLEALQCRRNLAGCYKDLKQYDKAEQEYIAVLSAMRSLLGGSHEEIAMTLNNLAMNYYASGVVDKAKPLFEQALSIWESTLGQNHPNTMTCRASIKALS